MRVNITVIWIIQSRHEDQKYLVPYELTKLWTAGHNITMCALLLQIDYF
jgi:hypothetical protein